MANFDTSQYLRHKGVWRPQEVCSRSIHDVAFDDTYGIASPYTIAVLVRVQLVRFSYQMREPN